MARPRRPLAVVPPDVVPHPRYGTTVASTGLGMSDAELRDSYWAYRDATLFAQSAIKADLRAQNFITMGRPYYVDLLLTCRGCQRPFLFFAREQQHWYEQLGFYIEARCVHCVECRRSHQQLVRRQRRYAAAVGKPWLADDALATLVSDAVYLWDAGLLSDEQKLRRLRNLARKRIAGSRAAHAIDRALARLGKTPQAS